MKIGRPKIDLFASKACCHLQSDMAWRPDPEEPGNKFSPINFSYPFSSF